MCPRELPGRNGDQRPLRASLGVGSDGVGLEDDDVRACGGVLGRLRLTCDRSSGRGKTDEQRDEKKSHQLPPWAKVLTAREVKGIGASVSTPAQEAAKLRAPADVAQLVEHFTRNEGVRGSNPRVGSRFPGRRAPAGQSPAPPASRRSAPSCERPVRASTVPLAYGHGATRQETESGEAPSQGLTGRGLVAKSAQKTLDRIRCPTPYSRSARRLAPLSPSSERPVRASTVPLAYGPERRARKPRAGGTGSSLLARTCCKVGTENP